MKRLCFLAVLLTARLFGPAGRSFSFNLGSHRVHVESARHCRFAAVRLGVDLQTPPWAPARRDRYEDEPTAMPARPVPAVPQTVSPPRPAAIAIQGHRRRNAARPSTPPQASRTYPADPPPLAPQDPAEDSGAPIPPSQGAGRAPRRSSSASCIRWRKRRRRRTLADRRMADRGQGNGADRKVRRRAVRLRARPGNIETGEAILINMKPKNAEALDRRHLQPAQRQRPIMARCR